jgi:hypothetical protein
MKLQVSIFFITILATFFSCSEESVTGSSNGKRILEQTENHKSRLAKIELVKFNYTIDTSYFEKEGKFYILDCRLYNGNEDTLYIYTESCYEWELSFDYDTSKIDLFQRIHCNKSIPIIKPIPPKSDLKFKSDFFVKDRKTKNIKVQYYIYQVDANFDLKNRDSIKKLERKIIYN